MMLLVVTNNFSLGGRKAGRDPSQTLALTEVKSITGDTA